jgi:radical SAM superfamily enzyme YgiQ (UPF0313 family)
METLNINNTEKVQNLDEIFYIKFSKIFKKKIDKILFIIPPDASKETFNLDLVLAKRYPAFPPYGAGLLVRNLKDKFKDNINCNILDLNFELLKSAHEKGREFNYDIWKEHVENNIKNFNPDLICFSVMFTMGIEQAHMIAKLIKNNNPTPIGIGGVAISNDIEGTMKVGKFFDFGFLYEGDVALIDFIYSVNHSNERKKLHQVATVIDEQVYVIKDRITPSECDISKRPDYCNLEIGKYSDYGAVGAYNFLRSSNEKASTIISNRGCRAKCTFCSVRTFNGLGVRGRSIDSIIEELKFNKKKHNISHYMWLDDDLLKNQQRAFDLFTRIKKENLNITWDATNGLIAAAMTDELMNAAVDSGCVGFNLGLESGNDEILRSIKKPGNKKSYLKSKIIFDKYPRIFVKGFTIIGFPNEKISQINDTVNFFNQLEFHWYPIQLLTPLTGTDITNEMIEQGIVPPDHKETNFRGLAAGSKSKSGGVLRNRELNEKKKTSKFFDLLTNLDPNYVPNKQELDDIWFSVDYKLNYEKLLHIKNKDKLEVIKLMLSQITDQYTVDNAMGNTYLAYIEKTLGNEEAYYKRLKNAKKFVDESAYWQVRFEALKIDNVLSSL